MTLNDLGSPEERAKRYQEHSDPMGGVMVEETTEKLSGIDIDFRLELIYSDEVEEKIQELLKENKIRIIMDYYISGGSEVRQTSINWIPRDDMQS